ncbi:MAG: dephospho-CoA kinase [Bdellovibrionales bacterium]
MKWIGLTGGIASGKSTVSDIFRRHGIPIIDADVLARRVVEKGSDGLKDIVTAFGPDMLSQDGSLDRKKMAVRVFQNKKDLEKLENILHPRVRQLFDAEKHALQNQNHRFGIYDVPLLFEKKMEPLFDGIIVVHASPELQKARMKKRDALGDEEITRRLQSQMDLKEKVKKAHWVIRNSGSLQELENQVTALITKLRGSP